MSRLGDLIRLERTRRGLSPKAAAKLCGVNEKFIIDVEGGKRIIEDVQARRMLQKMGMAAETEAGLSLEDIASTVDLETAVPDIHKRTIKPAQKTAPRQEDEDTKSNSSIWLDALSSMLRRVPIYNAVMQECGHRLLPVEKGKIEGYPAEKVFYFKAPDHMLRGFRIQRNDIVLIVPQSNFEDGAIMLLDTPQGKMLRMVKEMPRFQVMLQTYNEQFESDIRNLSDTVFIGKAIRLEADLI